MKQFFLKNVLGVAIGTFLSIQVVPTATLAVYQTLMTPWRNQAEIERLDRQVEFLNRQVQQLHDRLLNAE